MKHIIKGWIAVIVAAAVIIIDQLVKIYVKTHFYLGETVQVLPFFELKFVQNNGMAFGMELGSKLFLSLFRIVVVAVAIWYLVKVVRDKAMPRGFVVTLALIIAGAAGNIFDCVLYGSVFSNPPAPFVAEFVPWGEGYSSLLHGYVVDMLYFPLFSFEWPTWVPWLGGSTFSFFDPVFNIADAAITVGMMVLIFFYHKYLVFDSDKEGKDKA